jgi:hypothetical protein
MGDWIAFTRKTDVRLIMRVRSMAGPNQHFVEDALKVLRFKRGPSGQPGSGTKMEVTQDTLDLLATLKNDNKCVIVTDSAELKIEK